MMPAEHQAQGNGVFFIPSIKVDESLGAEGRAEDSVRTVGRNRSRRTAGVKLNTQLHVCDHLLRNEVHAGTR